MVGPSWRRCDFFVSSVCASPTLEREGRALVLCIEPALCLSRPLRANDP